MTTKILVPTALKAYTDNKNSIEIDGKNVQESILNFLNKFPKLEKHLLTPEGNIRNFVNIYLNDEDIRNLKNQETELKEGDVLSIVPSIADGNSLPELTNEEIMRYSRHLIMPEVAMTGQKKLKAANVLLIGVGGLGSPAALYLAAAGVGHLGIVDFDIVDLSNLQRQILHGTSSINLSKLDSAKKRLLDLNPNVDISTYEMSLNSENAFDVIREYDVVVDGTDNFPTRYLVNDACVLLEKPNVYGSIFRFEGQVSVFNFEDGPCYRWLYPEPPPPGLVPSCAEGGVLGILPGVIGTLQATEAIKLILEQGESLNGRLLLFDALKMNFRELKLRKDPNCPICGENPTIKELIDYNEFCGISLNGNGYETEFYVSPEELKIELEETDCPLFLDVREPQEFEICHFDEAKLIPLSQIPNRIHELSTADDIVLYCKVGQRSAQAMNFLKEAGFKKVRNLKGGIDAWAEKVDLEMPRY